MDKQVLKQQVKDLIAQNRLKEALKLLDDNDYDVTSLQNRLTTYHQKLLARTETADYYDRTINRIVVDIQVVLDTDDEQQNHDDAPAQPPAPPVQPNPAPKTKTYYEKLIERLKNNPIVAWLLVLFAVTLGLIKLIEEFGSLFPDENQTTLIVAGYVLDSLSGDPIEGAKVTILGKDSTSDRSNKKGEFQLAFPFSERQVKKFRLVKYGYQTFVSDPVILEPGKDTLFLAQQFIIAKNPIPPTPAQDNPPPKVNNRPKTFSIQFIDEAWNLTRLVQLFQDAGYTYSNSSRADIKIKFEFEADAIKKPVKNYIYDTSDPIVSVNGKRLPLDFEMSRPSNKTANKSSLYAFLQAKIDSELSNDDLKKVLDAVR